MKPFYITTPIYYVNDRPHIGHAYTSVACDAIARFMRLAGYRVKFLTGTDEHGQKVEKSAAKEGVSAQDFVDQVSEHFRELARLMNVSQDDFIRTTEARHIKTAQALWRRMQANGFIYEGKYAGWYAVRDEAFYAESELVEGKAPTGAEVEWVEEPSYFFKLSEFQDRLLAFYEEHPDFIQPPARRNEVLQFVRGGLQDLSISRTSFRWGIPVPGDEKHIMYVWLDALANYLSALGWAENAADFQDFWPADLHMVGKDILRFHAVYWPAFLMSADLPPPLHVFAHGWWTIEGEKMSKSLGNVVAPQELVERYGLDQTRYFLLRGVTFGADGNFSRERMHLMVNADLANTIGNLAQRTLSFVQKHADGVVPDSEEQRKIHEDLQPLLARFQRQEAIEAFYRTGDFSGMLEGIRQFAVACNEFIDAEAPWKLKKENKISEMNAALRALLEAIRKIAIMLQPFMPDTMRRCLVMLGYAEAEARRGIPFSELGDANSFHLQAGAKLGEIAPLFPRLEGEV